MSVVTIRVGGYAPRDSSHSGALEHFAEHFTAATDGEVPVEILWNIMDQGRPATDLLEMVAAGELTFCYFSSSYIGKTVPELDVLEIPFLFEDLSHAHRSLDGDLGKAITSATERTTNFCVLGYWDNGFRHFTNRLRPVRTPDDVAGMSVRLQPNAIHEDMIDSWGGAPVPIELSQGIELIRTLGVDAQENPLANCVAYGVDQVHGHVSMTSHLYGARGLYAHPDSLDKLGGEVQELFRESLHSAILWQRRVAAEKEEAIRSDLELDGLRFVDLTPDETRTFRDATLPVIDKWTDVVGVDLVGLADRAR